MCGITFHIKENAFNQTVTYSSSRPIPITGLAKLLGYFICFLIIVNQQRVNAFPGQLRS